jgi:hypothetical protein
VSNDKVNTNTIKRNKETLTDASKESGPGINTEKTKFMLLSLHQNAGQNPNIKVANRSFENMAQFKYLGMTVTNQNLLHEENKSRLNKGNAYYHSIQNLLFSCLLSKNVEINIQNYNFVCV